jgi:general secretion pathway protein M
MLQQRWNEANARERLFIIVMGLVLCLAAVFVLLVRPAWRTVQTAPAALRALDAKVLSMRAQSAYLRSAPTAISATAPAAASPLQSAEQLKGSGATVTIARDTSSAATATLNLTSIEGARLAAWLATPEVSSQLQRLNLTRDPASGRLSGAIVLRSPS